MTLLVEVELFKFKPPPVVINPVDVMAGAVNVPVNVGDA